MIALESYVSLYNSWIPEYKKLHERINTASSIPQSATCIAHPLVILPIAAWHDRLNTIDLYITAFEYALDTLPLSEQLIIKEHYINNHALKELVGSVITDSKPTTHFSLRTIYRKKRDAEQHFIERFARYNPLIT